MKNKIKYLSVMMVLTLSAIACIACSSGGDIGNTSSENISTDVSDESSSEIVSSQEAVSSEVSSAVSSEIMSSAMTSSKAVTSSSPSSKAAKVESKAQVSSKVPTSSQINPKPVSSQPAKSKPTSSEMPLFGELMDEAVIDKIIAEGIAYAESKGMTWKDDYTIEGNGYYNPAFSGEGAEIFKRDLFYNIDQVYNIALEDKWYVEGNSPYYKIVKGEFEEQGYWYGFVLY